MDGVVSRFHTLSVDGKTHQILLLLECDKKTKFNGNLYLSDFGDISSDGATFVDEMTSGSDYVCGCVPSKTMTVSLMNVNGFLNGHNFGWLNTFVGVRYAHEATSYASGTYSEYYFDGGQEQGTEGTYSCRSDGFYRDGVRVRSGNCTGAVLADNITLYFFITTSTDTFAYKYNMQTGSYSKAKKVTAAMCKNFTDGKFVVAYVFGNPTYRELTVISDGYEDSYYASSFGHFNADRSNRTSGDIIGIQDAFDIVKELDVDAAPLLVNLSATDGKTLLNSVLSWCGLSATFSTSAVESRFTGISVDMEVLMNNSYTCRKLVSYLCEAVGCNARWKPTSGELLIYTPMYPASAKNYPITLNRVESNGFEVRDKETGKVDCIAVKSLSNDTLLYPSNSGTCVYEVNGNPFVTNATSTLYQRLSTIPSYTPMTLSVLEADPSFQSGDLIRVYLTNGDDDVLTTHSGVAIANHEREDITVDASMGNYVVPLTSQTVTWNVNTSATYSIIGTVDGGEREVDNYTDTNARTAKYISADYITSGYISSDRIQAGTISTDKLTSQSKDDIVKTSSSKTQYYLSTSDSSATGGAWKDTVPTWSSGKYMWTRTVTNTTNLSGGTNTSYSTAVYDKNLTTALSTAATAKSTADSANSKTQLIYHSANVGTASVTAPTAWVTDVTGMQLRWTAVRPVYDYQSPVLFVATQSKDMAGTVTCTTPVKDETTTIIDGGHIVTGTIDCNQVTVTNIDASNINTGTLNAIDIVGTNITGTSTITGATITGGELKSSGVVQSVTQEVLIKDGVITISGDDSLHITRQGVALYVLGSSAYEGSFNTYSQDTTQLYARHHLRIDCSDLTYNNHSSAIGTITSGSAQSGYTISAATSTPVASVSLTAGLWLIFGYVKWKGVSSAVRRYINISSTSGAENARVRTDAYTEANAQFQMECSGYLNVSSTTTYYLNAYTSVSGDILSTYTQMNAIRLL